VHKPAFLRCVWPNRLAARLTLLVAFTAALSVFIAGASALFMGWKAAESRALADARKDARSIAFSLSAPLAFADPAGTREVLELLSHQPDVLAVWVHDAEGRLLHSQGALNDPATVGASGSLREGRVVVTQPVVAGRSADLVGMVTLRIDLSATLDEFRKQIASTERARGASCRGGRCIDAGLVESQTPHGHGFWRNRGGTDSLQPHGG
jgi:hypothetical protein